MSDDYPGVLTDEELDPTLLKQPYPAPVPVHGSPMPSFPASPDAPMPHAPMPEIGAGYAPVSPNAEAQPLTLGGPPPPRLAQPKTLSQRIIETAGAQPTPPAPPSLGKRLLQGLAVGAAGFGNPEGSKIALDELNQPQKNYETQEGIYERGKQQALEEEKQQHAEDTSAITVNGVTYNVPTKDLPKLIAAHETNTTRENVAGETNQTKEDIAGKVQAGENTRESMKETAAQQLQKGRPVTLDQLAAQAEKEGDKKTLGDIQNFKASIAKAGKQEPGNFIAVNDGQGNTLGWADPKSRDWVPFSSVGGGAANKAVGAGGVEPPKPSALESRTAKQAQYTIGLIDNGEEMIKEAQNELGAVNGRWNEFTAGKVGLPNAKWAAIDAQNDLIASAARLAHSQGRISPTTLKKVEDLMDAGKQDPANILAAMETLKTALTGAEQVFGGGAQGQGNAEPPPPKAGFKTQSRIVNGKKEYRQVPIGQ